MLRQTIKRLLLDHGVEVKKGPKMSDYRGIPDFEYYRPMFSPWFGLGDFKSVVQQATTRSLVSPDRLHVLYTLSQQATAVAGEFWECGVYKGGTATVLQKVAESGASPKQVRLFDTFEGMPETDAKLDVFHHQGDFADTSLQAIQKIFAGKQNVQFHPGFIPQTFAGLESSKIAFAHVDVDIYHSVKDCCDFIYPRMQAGGFMVFDDYGFPSCPGARKAVDEFFADKLEKPLVLSTGQAVVFVMSKENLSGNRHH